MRSMAFVSIACLAASLGVVAADDPKQLQDLTAVIALNGKPCGGICGLVGVRPLGHVGVFGVNLIHIHATMSRTCRGVNVLERCGDGGARY